jgi:hypothetical protein
MGCNDYFLKLEKANVCFSVSFNLLVINAFVMQNFNGLTI